MLKLLAEGTLSTKYGEFTEYLFYDGLSELIALVKGDVTDAEEVLCRVHSHCVPAHIFNSIECDCREQMALAQERIEADGKGVIIWLDQEAKGNGHMAAVLSAQLKMAGIPQTEAYQQLGYEKDARSFAGAVEALKFLKVASIKLMTNNPKKISALTSLGVKVANTEGIFIAPDNPELHKTYLDKILNQNHSIKI